MTLKSIWLSLMIISIMLFASCATSPEQTAVSPPKVEDKTNTGADVQNTDDLGKTGPALPADPQEMSFTASDGYELQGTYFPSVEGDAPLVVLMHWAQSDQGDWREVAYWLQNRGMGGLSENPKNLPWLDSAWFPEMKNDSSYAVFTFTFRGCEGGCKSFDREKWLLDAQSAAEFVRGLEGVNSDNIAMVGASIGSDGAADGCLHLNSLYPGACKGAFSQSSGNYLTLVYSEVVSNLGKESPPVPAWCLYSEADPESFGICNGITAPNYTEILYPADAIQGFPHGMMLIQPDVEPNPLDLLLEFLEGVLN